MLMRRLSGNQLIQGRTFNISRRFLDISTDVFWKRCSLLQPLYLPSETHIHSHFLVTRVSLRQDCEHSVVQLSRPVKLRRTPMRSRQSLRASIIYKGPVQLVSQQAAEATASTADPKTPAETQRETTAESVDGEPPHINNSKTEGSHR